MKSKIKVEGNFYMVFVYLFSVVALQITLRNWELSSVQSQKASGPGRFLRPEEIMVGDGRKMDPDPRTADWTTGLRGLSKMLMQNFNVNC